MRIDVKVTDGELDEIGMTVDELKSSIISDLDHARDYPGFNVHVVIACFSDDSIFE